MKDSKGLRRMRPSDDCDEGMAPEARRKRGKAARIKAPHKTWRFVNGK